MTDLTMIELCKTSLPKVYVDQGDIAEIERLRSAKLIVADAAVMSPAKRNVASFLSITVHGITPAGRAIVSTFRPL
jgi:hypothetical protein